jgi:3-oxoacid CoA-transferase subunit B
MEHTAKDGSPKILAVCNLPLTGRRVVHDIVTELGWIKVTPTGLLLEEIAEGLTPEAVQAKTAAPLAISPALKVMVV